MTLFLDPPFSLWRTGCDVHIPIRVSRSWPSYTTLEVWKHLDPFLVRFLSLRALRSYHSSLSHSSRIKGFTKRREIEKTDKYDSDIKGLGLAPE